SVTEHRGRARLRRDDGRDPSPHSHEVPATLQQRQNPPVADWQLIFYPPRKIALLAKDDDQTARRAEQPENRGDLEPVDFLRRPEPGPQWCHLSGRRW